MASIPLLALLAAALGLTATAGHAQDIGPSELGVRAGTKATRAAESFQQYDVFAVFELPAHAQPFDGWRLDTRLNITGGALRGDGEIGFIGTFGMGVALHPPSTAFTFDAGVGYALLSRHSFGRQDFGAPFQFIAHGGIGYRVTRHFELGYRIHHMSDAGLFNGEDLNQHIIELSYHY